MQLEGSPHSQSSAAGASLQTTQIQHNENSYLMVQKEQMQLNRSERYSSPICLLLLLTMRCAVVQAMFDRYCQPQASVISICACLCRPLRPPLPTTAQVDHVLEGYNACIFAYGQARAAPTQPAPIARPRTQDTLPSLLIPETHRRAPRRRRGGLRHDPRPLRTYHGRRGAVTVSAAVVTCNPHRRRHRIGRTIITRRF